MKKLLFILLAISLISCSKEEINPQIKVSVISTNSVKYKRFTYAFTGDLKEDVFIGSKEFTHEISKKEHYFYFEYLAEAELNDSIRIVGLNTDTIFLLTNNMSKQILIK